MSDAGCTSAVRSAVLALSTRRRPSARRHGRPTPPARAPSDGPRAPSGSAGFHINANIVARLRERRRKRAVLVRLEVITGRPSVSSRLTKSSVRQQAYGRSTSSSRWCRRWHRLSHDVCSLSRLQPEGKLKCLLLQRDFSDCRLQGRRSVPYRQSQLRELKRARDALGPRVLLGFVSRHPGSGHAGLPVTRSQYRHRHNSTNSFCPKTAMAVFGCCRRI